jgi:hypothetical protein
MRNPWSHRFFRALRLWAQPIGIESLITCLCGQNKADVCTTRLPRLGKMQALNFCSSFISLLNLLLIFKTLASSRIKDKDICLWAFGLTMSVLTCCKAVFTSAILECSKWLFEVSFMKREETDAFVSKVGVIISVCRAPWLQFQNQILEGGTHSRFPSFPLRYTVMFTKISVALCLTSRPNYKE